MREHLGIVEAMARRDGDLAEARTRAHIRAARENMFRLWSSGPGA